MRRFLTLALLLFFAIPFGISIAGCSKKTAVTYCNGQNSGVIVGQPTTLNLEPRLTGISLNQGQFGQISSPSASDCRGTVVGVNGAVYASSNVGLVDVVPNTGRLCAGTFNRNSGGQVADYTVCTRRQPPGSRMSRSAPTL